MFCVYGYVGVCGYLLYGSELQTLFTLSTWKHQLRALPRLPGESSVLITTDMSAVAHHLIKRMLVNLGAPTLLTS